MQQNSILNYLKKSGSSRPDNSRPGQPYHRHPQSGHSSRHDQRGQHRGPNRRRNMDLKRVADETKAELPEVLADISGFDAMDSSLNNLKDLDPLDPNDCPNFVLPRGDPDAGKIGTRIRVFDMDSFDVALKLDPDYKVHTHLGIPPDSISGQRDTGFTSRSKLPRDDSDMTMLDTENYDTSETEDELNDIAGIEEDTAAIHLSGNSKGKSKIDAKHSIDSHNVESSTQVGKGFTASSRRDISHSTTNNLPRSSTSTKQRVPKPVAVLNLASERSPGGGWQNGALAQEECLCYRSSLYLSLHRSYYRLPSLSAIHSPNVVLIRDAMSRGHTLLTNSELPENLPVTSVISVAALRHPQLSDDGKTFRNPGQRSETKRKIRLTLRVAAMKGHTKLVLGALGCGVFANPPKEVALCFLEVLREKEFQGGRWEDVAFGVLDNAKGPNGGKDGNGNFGIFYRVLDGQVV